MPSTALATDAATLDLDHLARMSFGDKALEREVLVLFLAQSERIAAALASHPGETAALSHALKGSAQAIGAFALAECADALEAAVLQGSEPEPVLARLREALAAARGAIEARLGRL
jgi:HPt (histidine-containing phosphotransfer) domain-containing protein